MDINAVIKSVQAHFTDGLVLVIGSGLSAAEGIPGMSDLASRLDSRSASLAEAEKALWSQIKAKLDADEGLEAALLRHPPTEPLEAWIGRETCGLLLPAERKTISEVLAGTRTLRLTKFLAKVIKPANGLPILTPNYDRLIEVGCEVAGFHVDTTAVGHYAGHFDHARSCMGSCRGILRRGKGHVLDHHPRAIVLKPHGSFDWYRFGTDARRCSIDLDLDRMIITPGLNKYRAGYDSPFDKHRDLANDYIKQARRLLVVGYGFNDDHLQTHLLRKISDGTPTLILNRSLSAKVEKLAREAPSCLCISKPTASPGVAIVAKEARFDHSGQDWWDLGILAEEILT